MKYVVTCTPREVEELAKSLGLTTDPATGEGWLKELGLLEARLNLPNELENTTYGDTDRDEMFTGFLEDTDFSDQWFWSEAVLLVDCGGNGGDFPTQSGILRGVRDLLSAARRLKNNKDVKGMYCILTEEATKGNPKFVKLWVERGGLLAVEGVTDDVRLEEYTESLGVSDSVRVVSGVAFDTKLRLGYGGVSCEGLVDGYGIGDEEVIPYARVQFRRAATQAKGGKSKTKGPARAKSGTSSAQSPAQGSQKPKKRKGNLGGIMGMFKKA